MKEKLFKFKVSSVQYGELLREELAAIKNFIGDYEIVKKRDCLLKFDMIIWCRKKDDTDKKILDEIIRIVKTPSFDENAMSDICELLKRYGKLD